MTPISRFSFPLRLAVYLITVVILFGIGFFSAFVAASYQAFHIPSEDTVGMIGFAAYLIVAIAAFAQWRVLRPRDTAVVVMADAGFWIAGFPAYLTYADRMTAMPIVVLRALFCILIIAAAIYGVTRADIFGSDAQKARRDEENHWVDFSASEHH